MDLWGNAVLSDVLHIAGAADVVDKPVRRDASFPLVGKGVHAYCTRNLFFCFYEYVRM